MVSCDATCKRVEESFCLSDGGSRFCGEGKVPNQCLFFVDQGNSGSRKKRQQVSHAQQIQWKAELAQAKEAMCWYWPPIRQDTPL